MDCLKDFARIWEAGVGRGYPDHGATNEDDDDEEDDEVDGHVFILHVRE